MQDSSKLELKGNESMLKPSDNETINLNDPRIDTVKTPDPSVHQDTLVAMKEGDSPNKTDHKITDPGPDLDAIPDGFSISKLNH